MNSKICQKNNDFLSFGEKFGKNPFKTPFLASQPIKIFTILRKIPAFPLKTTIKTFLFKADFKDFSVCIVYKSANFL